MQIPFSMHYMSRFKFHLFRPVNSLSKFGVIISLIYQDLSSDIWLLMIGPSNYVSPASDTLSIYIYIYIYIYI